LNINGVEKQPTPPNEHWAIHNDGHRGGSTSRSESRQGSPAPQSEVQFMDPQFSGTKTFVPEDDAKPKLTPSGRPRPPTYFSAQSYLRYQGDKFVKRFDANCYIAMTRKLDTHDVSRHRVDPAAEDTVLQALGRVEQPALVLGIESDGLFTFAEQQEIAAGIPDSRLKRIDSPEGHDAFLLQFEQVNRHIVDFFHEVLPDIMSKSNTDGAAAVASVQKLTKSSTFGEAEVEDITAW
jgi:homoserine O-acetyltransferase